MPACVPQKHVDEEPLKVGAFGIALEEEEGAVEKGPESNGWIGHRARLCGPSGNNVRDFSFRVAVSINVHVCTII